MGDQLVLEGAAVDDGTLRERKKRHTRRTIHEVALRLVSEKGLAGVTIDEICGEAQVSQRTFFNYFRSKSAAAVGQAELQISDEAREAFLDGAPGDLLDDLCHLISSTIDQPVDRQQVRALVDQRPELAPTLVQGMAELRQVVVGLAEQRAGLETGRAAVALVMASLFDAMRPSDGDADLPFEERLRRAVASVVELIGRLSGPTSA